MHFWSSDRLWVGETPAGPEISIRCDFFDEDRLDPACEALTLRELGDLDRLRVRIDEFLATSPRSRPAHLLGGRWELARLHCTNIDDQGIVHDGATFFAELHLSGDFHNVWVVRVEDGAPVALSGR